MRGEHLGNVIESIADIGSSPHARGARDIQRIRLLPVGIIPACAGSTSDTPSRAPHSWDHPRMRGEHVSTASQPAELRGSSPHARGAPPHEPHRSDRPGIIPACAGSTILSRISEPICWDHPRMRGEHIASPSKVFREMGSSPHARGARGGCGGGGDGGGIIPACAGSTSTPWRRAGPRRDHPRMRGEHLSVKVVVLVPMGSSPHARGAHRDVPGRDREDGIIPACAGSTRRARRRSIRPRDHPRMRGEHHERGFIPKCDGGSSPHARGARSGAPRMPLRHGIIPACAGSTWFPFRWTAVGWDHPRMRGEHVCLRLEAAFWMGSSPHARGAPSRREGRLRPRGIIPACAGSTTRRRSRSSITRDHPRMRGEHLVLSAQVVYSLGSSPHARGAHRSRSWQLPPSGIIPACAGSTCLGKSGSPC